MPALSVGATCTYDGNTSTAANTASTFGANHAAVSGSAIVFKNGVSFNNVSGTPDVTAGETSIPLTGGQTVTTNTQELNITSGGWFGVTVTINSGVYVWSNSTSNAALTISVPATVINNGYIMGRGGNGGANTGAGAAGGPALKIQASGVSITNNSGAYIAGGGGGGGGGVGAGNYCGGGGGAGGGIGGNGGNGAAGAAGAVGSMASDGGTPRRGPPGYGGGGAGGYEWGAREGGAGGSGGRMFGGPDVRNTCANPGWNGTSSCYAMAYGRGGNTAGQANTDGGGAGGGGGYGAAGGTGGQNGDTPTRTVFSAGGAGGAAISAAGYTYSLTNNGNVWGAT